MHPDTIAIQQPSFTDESMMDINRRLARKMCDPSVVQCTCDGGIHWDKEKYCPVNQWQRIHEVQ
jgi:hypothetical protein